jgi:hypothetical protein
MTRISYRARAFCGAPTDFFTPTALLLILGLALLSQVSSIWIPTRDGVSYLSIARGIASGEGLFRFGSPHLFFAPGYPALIAPAFLFSDQPFLLISFIHWLLSIAFLCATFGWFKRQMPEHALLLSALCVANVSVLYYFRRTLSEAAFMPLLMCTAVLMDRALDHAGSAKGFKYLLLAALAGSYLCTVRFVGVTLAAGFALMLLLKISNRQITVSRATLLATFGVGLPLAAALAVMYYDRAMAALSGDHLATYTDHFTRHLFTLPERLLTSSRLRIQETGRILIPGMFKAYGGWLNPAMLLYVPLFVAVIAGWYRMLRRRPSAMLFAFPFYLALYLIWPFDQGTRFMTPMVPVLWLALAGLIVDSQWWTQRFSPWLLAGCLATSVTFFVADRLEARKTTAYWKLIETISEVVPKRSRVAFMRTSQAYSASPFSALCLLKFDRRCSEIRALPEPEISPRIEYIAVLGPALSVSGFTTVLSQEDLTVLKREKNH